MYEPAVGPVMVCTPSLEHAASASPPSSDEKSLSLVMAGLRLGDPRGLRVIVQRVAADRMHGREVPDVLGVVPRANTPRDFAVVIAEQVRRRSEARIDLRPRRRVEV